jgi:hypothetical protein
MLPLSAHGSFISKVQDHCLVHTNNVHEYSFIDFQLHQHEYDYFNYSSGLVSTRKLVEDSLCAINN